MSLGYDVGNISSGCLVVNVFIFAALEIMQNCQLFSVQSFFVMSVSINICTERLFIFLFAQVVDRVGPSVIFGRVVHHCLQVLSGVRQLDQIKAVVFRLKDYVEVAQLSQRPREVGDFKRVGHFEAKF